MNTDIIIVKIAESKEEFQQIHQLNYDTFVEEIKQHNPNSSKQLIDQFDSENIYYIAKSNDEIVGMLALRDKRPFSLDNKIPNLDTLLPKYNNIVEIRLLSVKKEYRHSKVLFLILEYLIQDNAEKSYDLAIISGILNQQRLYKHMGFKNMGPVLGDGPKFQPMFLTRDRYIQFQKQVFKKNADILNLLPGPVEIAENVKQAFSKEPISHRSSVFIEIFNRTKENLLNLTSAKHVEILTGTGTTANDAVAGQISLLNAKGLIISNGEFGERLYKHADNFHLEYLPHKISWGEAFALSDIEQKIKESDAKWLWFVHHETSTGMINNLDDISKLCQKYDIKICVDIISSLGTQKVDLSNIYLASAVSSKGMASFSGLSIVFYNHDISKQKQLLPSNINLSIFNKAAGIPFTLSSNLLFALDMTLQNFKDFDKRINSIKYVSDKLRDELESKAVKILVEKDNSSPATMTLIINKEQNSVEVGNSLRKNNILVSFESEYLVSNNWIQVCFMGAEPDYNKIKEILKYL